MSAGSADYALVESYSLDSLLDDERYAANRQLLLRPKLAFAARSCTDTYWILGFITVAALYAGLFVWAEVTGSLDRLSYLRDHNGVPCGKGPNKWKPYLYGCTRHPARMICVAACPTFAESITLCREKSELQIVPEPGTASVTPLVSPTATQAQILQVHKPRPCVNPIVVDADFYLCQAASTTIVGRYCQKGRDELSKQPFWEASTGSGPMWLRHSMSFNMWVFDRDFDDVITVAYKTSTENSTALAFGSFTPDDGPWLYGGLCGPARGRAVTATTLRKGYISSIVKSTCL
eukprot:TRINITY_DN36960_c0_g1_i3.p1 TRINITY_DN36960_c0_g1~~TRINITY_DN36960_c0_g1_i3.p1  ORF type:complete len:291 (+),score=9.15 TRINITY_DN36960_c0_g1_i3:102-974(+)